MLRRTALVLATLAVTACTSELDSSVQNSALADFRLQHLVVIVDEPTTGALSRKLEDPIIKAAVSEAMERRFRRFEGRGEYSIGIKVAGYVLAQPGIPVLLAPRSMLLLNVGVFDADQKRINEDWKRMTVFEDAGGDTVLGSGYTQSGEEQLEELADNAAIEIEKWLRENPEWFTLPPEAPSAEGPRVEDAET